MAEADARLPAQLWLNDFAVAVAVAVDVAVDVDVDTADLLSNWFYKYFAFICWRNQQAVGGARLHAYNALSESRLNVVSQCPLLFHCPLPVSAALALTLHVNSLHIQLGLAAAFAGIYSQL